MATLYSNQDTGAPQLTGEAGSMIALLDAVLVTGYGTQPGAGWTKEFSGANLAVYRASTVEPGASGMYLRVDDTNIIYSKVKAYKTMSDINTGTDVIPSGNPAYTNTEIFWNKATSGSSAARIWAIVADNRTFYMNASPNSTPPDTEVNAFIYGAGDFESFVPGNVHNYFIAGTYNSTATDSNIQITNDQSTYGVALMGRAQDLVPGKQSKFWVPYFTHSAAVTSGSASHFLTSAYTGLRHFYPGFMVENAVQANITGRLRGVFGYAGRATGTWIENFGPSPDDLAGPDMIQFIASVTGGSALYISTGNW